MLQLFVEVAGWSAALLILTAYALLSLGKLGPRSRLYQVMNLVGAAGFIINSGWNHAYPSVALNMIWLAIAMVTLMRARQT